MLKKFSVKNFKNFKEELTLDFSNIREYEFNTQLIKNGLANKLFIYGKNNTGKSNLGAALMDITSHLTDNRVSIMLYGYYVNGDSTETCATFNYLFVFNGKEISYSYKKDSQRRLIEEELYEESTLLFKYNYQNNRYENNIPNTSTIDLTKNNTGMSALKYIYKNTMYWENDSSIRQLMEFVNNMLWFRSLKSNEFMGVMPNVEDLNDFIINNRRLNNFESFLRECGQDYHLCEISEAGKVVVGVRYKNFSARFDYVASTGTLTLWLFYYWMNRTSDISFVYLDEFDAFYHWKLSEYIMKYLNKNQAYQTILTSHNIGLISNELMRPDCYLILHNGKLSSLADSLDKNIRQGSNIEKMLIEADL